MRLHTTTVLALLAVCTAVPPAFADQFRYLATNASPSLLLAIAGEEVRNSERLSRRWFLLNPRVLNFHERSDRAPASFRGEVSIQVVEPYRVSEGRDWLAVTRPDSSVAFCMDSFFPRSSSGHFFRLPYLRVSQCGDLL